jgi:hypothetical protein
VLIIIPGREHIAQSTRDLASALQKAADTVTYIQRERARQRLEDEDFFRRSENLDGELVGGRPWSF